VLPGLGSSLFMSKRRRKKAILIPTDRGFIEYFPEFDDCVVVNPNTNEQIYIRNCREGDLIPGSIVIVKPVSAKVKELTMHKYWEHVT
jgi:hypothetical protein